MHQVMFSKTCEYAIKAAVFVSIRTMEGNKPGMKEVAHQIESPEHFTAKILQTLVKKTILRSSKGPNGGFYMDPEGDPVPVMRVLEAFGCDKFFYRCALGLKQCLDRHPCPVHEQFKFHREGLRDLMNTRTIQDLALEIQSGAFHIAGFKA